MFQKEVAERIVAKKGKQRGILSVLLQAYYDIEYCFTVNEDVFSPPPKVKSGVIKLSRNKVKQLPCDEKLFKQIVKVGFNQRRKTLRNALKSFSLESELAHTDLLRKRAEELSVEDFITITKICQNKEK
jgi:16S rRNA (adenine1518-N6/adenine1519-N6)-dimethyltransferase